MKNQNIPIPKQKQTQNQSKHTGGYYTFKRSVSIEDVAVAALIKFYLKEMEAEKPGLAKIMLQELVQDKRINFFSAKYSHLLMFEL